MNKRYFSSDFHLGSSNIIKYANRPFSSAEKMVDAIIENCNQTACDKSDVIIHVGDFLLHGSDNHDNILGKDTSSLSYSENDIKNKIHASLFMLSGNHDDNHNVTTIGKDMTINLNQNYVNVTVAHYPSTHDFYRYVGNNNRASCDINGGDRNTRIHIHLCGHVHSNWLLNYDAEHNVLNVNVGVDVWNYRPVRDSEITEMLDFIFKYHKFDHAWKMSVSDEKTWRAEVNRKIKNDRIVRKQARYEKKGLTPEICQQRKEEALRKKGLL